jgi:hypothetical protein
LGCVVFAIKALPSSATPTASLIIIDFLVLISISPYTLLDAVWNAKLQGLQPKNDATREALSSYTVGPDKWH